MTGLLADRLDEELITEIIWLKDAVTQINGVLNLSSYTLSLIKHRVEPECAQAIERMIFQHYQQIESMPFVEFRAAVAHDFEQLTGNSDFAGLVPDNVLRELLTLKLSELRPASEVSEVSEVSATSE